MKKIFSLTIIVLYSVFSFSQTNYEMDTYNGQTVTTCSGNFYDSGGSGGNYGPGESLVTTFCPATAGTAISFDFTLFSLSSGDQLQVFNGTTTSAPSFGTFGDVFSPVGMGVIASATNPSGCLTFEFTSGAGASAIGWEASISCATPCQTIHVGLQSSIPTANNGYIDICPGDAITFVGTGIFLENNAVYYQSNLSSSFEWDFSNGTTGSSQSMTVVFNDPGGYNIDLTVTDQLGCVSSNDLGLRVRVATDPTFLGTMVSDPVICHGEQLQLIGQVNPSPWEVSAELNWADTTFLPDGSGASYTTSLIFDAFAAGQTLTSANDILGICANMEHSYLGDLHITLECPSGQIVVLKSYPGGGGTFLGEPIDIDVNLNPGIGWDYCWSANPTYGTMNAESASYSTLPSGSYATIDPLTNLIGCPLNGAWTIEVTDNLLSDNGYIFGWGINFDPNILPANWTFTPDYPSQMWDVSSQYLIGSNGGTVTLQPDTGIQTVDFLVSDSYGCPYDTSITFEVLPTYIVDFGPDTTLCSDEILVLDATNGGTNTGAVYVWHDNMGNSGTGPSYTVDKPGTYWVEIPNIQNSCGHTDTITVSYNDMELDLGTDIDNICITQAQIIGQTIANADSYNWSTSATTDFITVTSSGVYTLSVTRDNCMEVDEIEVEFDNQLSINLGANQNLCTGNSIILDAGYSGYDYQWSLLPNSAIIATTQELEVSNGGTYSISVTNACGTFSDQIEITMIVAPVIELGANTSLCYGTVIELFADYPNSTVLWSDGSMLPSLIVDTAGFYEVFVTNQCGTTYDNIVIDVDFPLNVELGTDTSICNGDTIMLDCGFENQTYLWSNSETTQMIEVASPTSYVVTVSNACGDFFDFITIDFIPDLVFSLGNDTFICNGNSLTLDPQVSANSYEWSTGENSQTIDISNADTYTITVTNECETQESSINISIFPETINLGNDTNICDGQSIFFNAGNYSGSSYTWSSNEMSEIIEVTNAGTYSVSVSNYCGTAIGSINLGVFPNPSVYLGNDTIIDSGESLIIDAGSGFESYLWSTGDIGQSIEVTISGSYSVVVSNEYGCSDIDTIEVEILSSIDNQQSIENILIYPNPARDVFYISSENEVLKKAVIYNSIGKQIISESINSKEHSIDISKFSNGIYFIRLITKSNEIIIKPIHLVK